MTAFETYVIVSLETTGLPSADNIKPRITELSLLAVKRHHVLANQLPRVQHKLTLCFNPKRQITKKARELSGLTNELLANESDFDMGTFTLIKAFLERLTKPICFVAHNGHRFHFPILKQYLLELGVNFDSDLRYADSLHGFFDIMEGYGIHHVSNDMTDRYDVNRYYKPGNYIQTYTLPVLYKRTFPNVEFLELTPNLKDKCYMILQLFVSRAREMVEWFDTHNLLFSEDLTIDSIQMLE